MIKKKKRVNPIQEAIDFGIDLSITYERLHLTPTERLERNQQILYLIGEIKKTGNEKDSQFKKLFFNFHSFNVNGVFINLHQFKISRNELILPVLQFCYARDKENLENLVKALKPFHPYLRGAEKGLPFIFDALTLKKGLNFTFSTDIGDIDILGEVTGLGSYDEVLKYSETLEIYEIPCNVLTLEGLIKAKKASKRPKDLILLKELEAILEIQRQQKKKS